MVEAARRAKCGFLSVHVDIGVFATLNGWLDRVFEDWNAAGAPLSDDEILRSLVPLVRDAFASLLGFVADGTAKPVPRQVSHSLHVFNSAVLHLMMWCVYRLIPFTLGSSVRMAWSSPVAPPLATLLTG